MEITPLLDDAPPATGPERVEGRRPHNVFCVNPFLGLIWTAVAFNYAVHVLLRPERWNLLSLLLGHAILALQITSFVRCQLTHPGRVPDWWEERAKAGLEEATKCRKSQKMLPPRAQYVNNAGCVVLGLDHWCFWVSSTIGHYNRKFFVLFLLYSTLLAGFVGGHAFFASYSLLRRLEPHMGPLMFGMMGPAGGPMLAQWQAEMARRRAEGGPPGAHPAAVYHASLVDAFSDPESGGMWYQLSVFLTLIIDLVASIFLAGFVGWQVYLVMKGRTTVDSELTDEGAFDTGSWLLNTRQVMGRRASLWLLPVGGPDGDGLRWPAQRKAA